ncbi:hypothetical protein QPK24_05945 [Paenibacillus polygoni]|uniref:Uncharacterized protein n=1 Tax=Paenibacillus polygoni TaxID=3050112 RepID=A0ABY8X5A5_9BACL|nr:hypothetical protein [Paenibacillus polygoni]WIV20238.1 hypothetical protein QPK24_05945 [Paenibacillus polygoni]
MYTMEEEIKTRIRQLKQVISSYEIIRCLSNDLLDTSYDHTIYSDDLYLYRKEDDKFVYLHDNEDETEGRVSVEDLKIILKNIATRDIIDKYELKELDQFLNTEDDE